MRAIRHDCTYLPTYRSREDYTGNGVTTSYPYQFRIYEATDLVVTRADTDGNETPLVLNTDYTVTGAGKYAGGNVVLTSALASGYRLAIERALPVTQETDLRNQGAYFAEAHEDVFDRAIMLLQRVGSYLGLGPDGALRTLLLGKTDIDGQGAFRARQNRIQDLADPVAQQDAANLRWVLDLVAASLSDGSGNAVLQRLASSAVGDGVDLVANAADERNLSSSDPDKGAAMVAGVTRSVANYAAVRALSGAATRLKVGGRENYFDGAHGTFVVDESDAASADNDGTILVDGLGRRGKRQVISGAYDVAWWGAVPDAPASTGIGTDNAPKMRAALDAAFSAGVPVVYARSRAGGWMYRCQSQLNIRSGVVLEGDNETGARDNGSTLYFVGLAVGTKTIRLGNTTQDHSALGLRNMAVVGCDSTAGSGVLPNVGPDGVEFLRVKDNVILSNVGFKYIMSVFSQPRANFRWVQEIQNVSVFFCGRVFDDWNCNAGQFFNLNVCNVRTLGDISGSNNEFFWRTLGTSISHIDAGGEAERWRRFCDIPWCVFRS